MRFLLPIFMLCLVYSNLHATWQLAQQQRLFSDRNTQQELGFWFDVYAVKMHNSHFYLRARKWLEGVTLVASEPGDLRRYDLEHVTRVKEFRVQNFRSLDTTARDRLTRDTALDKHTLYLYVKSGGELQPKPVVFFVDRNSDRGTYYVYPESFFGIHGYLVIPDTHRTR